MTNQEQKNQSSNPYERPKAYTLLVNHCVTEGYNTIAAFCDKHGFCPCAVSRWGAPSKPGKKRRRPSFRYAVALEKATGGAVPAVDWFEG